MRYDIYIYIYIYMLLSAKELKRVSVRLLVKLLNAIIYPINFEFTVN